MNALTDPFQQLIDRKLWPIALVLVLALVAVPFLLKKDSEPEVVPSPTSTAALPAGQGTTESVVSQADAAKTDRLRATLGDRKDPFRPAQLQHVKKAGDDTLSAGTATAIGSAAGGSGSSAEGSTDAGSGGGTTAPTIPTATPAPAKTFELYSLKVRFGSTDGALKTRNVKRLTGLPGGTDPAALYLGLLEDHKSAVFIIDAGIEALGDGHCDPSPEDCQTLTLKKGETEFLTRGGTQYELDLVDIHVKRTTDAGAAKDSRAAIASDGRDKLRSLIGRIGSLRYDESQGALEKLPKAAQAKRVAKAARAARLSATG